MHRLTLATNIFKLVTQHFFNGFVMEIDMHFFINYFKCMHLIFNLHIEKNLKNGKNQKTGKGKKETFLGYNFFFFFFLQILKLWL